MNKKYLDKGFTIPAYGEIKTQAPFDNRAVVDTKYALINADTWRVTGETTNDVGNGTPGTLFIYQGMPVIAADTGYLYVYKGNSQGVSNSPITFNTITVDSVIYTRNSEEDINEAYCWKNNNVKIYTKTSTPVEREGSENDNNTAWKDQDFHEVKGYITNVTQNSTNKFQFRNNSNAVNSLSEDNKELLLNNLWIEYLPSSTAGNKIGITTLGTATSGYGKTYQLTYDGTPISDALIDIPKDLVVKSGSVVTAVAGTGENASKVYDGTGIEITDGVVGEKYIKLVINNDVTDQQNSVIFIPVKDLVDVYTTGSEDNDKVQIVIGNDNTISATIGGITENELDSTVTDILSLAESSIQDVDVTQTGNLINISESATDTTRAFELSIATSNLDKYDANGAATFNAELTDAISTETILSADQAAALNELAGVSSTEYVAGNKPNANDAILYNAQLNGAVKEGDLVSEGLVKASDLVDYVSNEIAGADNALYTVSTGNRKYITIKPKGYNDSDPDTVDDHNQQISAHVVTLANYNGIADNDGLISTSEVYNALTWN